MSKYIYSKTSGLKDGFSERNAFNFLNNLNFDSNEKKQCNIKNIVYEKKINGMFGDIHEKIYCCPTEAEYKKFIEMTNNKQKIITQVDDIAFFAIGIHVYELD